MLKIGLKNTHIQQNKFLIAKIPDPNREQITSY